MTLLKEVKSTETGLVGIMEDDKEILLGKPTPVLYTLPEGFPSTATLMVTLMAERDSTFFYEIAERDRGSTQTIYLKYPKRGSEN